MDNNSDFIFIEDCKNDVSRLMNEIELKCDKLEILYRDYLREAVKQKDYLMSLDTMFFQISLTKQDLKNNKTLLNSFLNTVYGQYFKFYKKILNSLEECDTTEIFNDFSLIRNFRTYYDLEDSFEYTFDEIDSVHSVIYNIINLIEQYIHRKKYTIEDDNIRVEKGINIHHLVYQKTHNIEVLTQKNLLFKKILNDYYISQKKFFKRLQLKLKIQFCQLDSDIKFDTVTYRSRESVTTKIDTILDNNSGSFENLLLDDLQIQDYNKKSFSERAKDLLLLSLKFCCIDFKKLD